MSDARDLIERFRVKPGDRPHLHKRDTRDRAGFNDKDDTKGLTLALAKDIDRLQDRLYAEGRRSLLVVLQGMDTSGKDSTVQDVFGQTTPLGVTVTSFKRPSEEELAHDYLWRVHMACPKRGTIGVFNRSHYEDVLVSKVHSLIPNKVLKDRYDQINAFEQMLTQNGTTILKFMLNLSKDEQKKRFQDRLDDPVKRWKFNPGDLDDRKLWDRFQKAYEATLRHCSTPWAPWYVIPADSKWVRNAAIATIVKATLDDMNPIYPQPTWRADAFDIT